MVTSWWVSGASRARLAHEIDDDRVAPLDRACLDHLEPRRPLAQRLQRFVDRPFLQRGLRPAQLQRGVRLELEARHGIERRRELQRLALFDDDVADVGRVERLEAALAQRVVHRARHQLVDHVVENLAPEPLLDDPRAAPCPGGSPGCARPCV